MAPWFLSGGGENNAGGRGNLVREVMCGRSGRSEAGRWLEGGPGGGGPTRRDVSAPDTLFLHHSRSVGSLSAIGFLPLSIPFLFVYSNSFYFSLM